MPDDPQQKIVVEVPSTSGNFSPVSSPSPESRIENFRREWRNAIAFPDNLSDIAFDCMSWITVPALLTSCWVSIPFPSFIRLGMMLILVITGVIACYLRKTIPEIENILLIRLGLVFVGVVIGA